MNDIYCNLLHDESIRGEKTAWLFRWALYSLLLVLAFNVYLFQSAVVGAFGMLLSFSAMLYNVILIPVIKNKKNYTWIRYISVTIDIVFLTAYNAIDTYQNSTLAPVTDATLILYPVLLFLASLRIDRLLIIFATLLSIVSMNVLFAIAYPFFDQQIASKLVSADILGEVYRSLYVCLCGFLMLFFPGTIERLLKAQKNMYEDRMNLFELARIDKLTCLANRIRVDEYLPVEIERAKRNNFKIAVYYMDLDGFKPVNDNYGHDKGDLILTEVGFRLKGIIRPYDLAARVGGDEFIVIIEKADTTEIRKLISTRIRDLFLKPFVIGDTTIQVGTSIGMSVYPDDSKDPSTLIDIADKEMLQAKKKLKIGEREKPLEIPGGL